jgi:hypothetical protein
MAHRWMLPMLEGWREVLFPGFAPLALGIAGMVVLAKDRSVPLGGTARGAAGFYALITVLALWTSFGPDAGLYTALFHALPVFSFLRAPGRFGMMVSLCMAVLMALFLARTWRDWVPRRRTAAAVALTALVAAELAVGPLFVRDVGPPPAAHVALAHLPAGAVAEFPFFTRRPELPRHTRYMYLSTYHWHPLINGYSDYFPRAYRTMLAHVDGFPDRGSMNELRKRRVRYVILHVRQYGENARNRLVREVEDLVRKGYVKQHVRGDDDVWLLEVVGWP